MNRADKRSQDFLLEQIQYDWARQEAAGESW
jgi:hypothetical protein